MNRVAVKQDCPKNNGKKRKKSHKRLSETNGCATETFLGTNRLTDTHGQTSIFFLSNTLALSKQTLTFNTYFTIYTVHNKIK